MSSPATPRLPLVAPLFEHDDEPTENVARPLWTPPPPPRAIERRRSWVLPIGFASVFATLLVLVALLVR